MAGAHVQGVTNLTQDDGGTYTTVAATLNSVAAGSHIVVNAGCGGSVASPTCSDGVAYTLATNTYDATNGQTHLQFYKENSSSGNKTVTVTWGSAQSYNRLAIMEVSGLEASASLEGSNAQAQAGATTTDYYSSGNITTANTSFVIGCSQNIAEATPGTGTITAGATPAYTLRENGGTGIIVTETLASQAAGTFDANFTRNTAHRCITAVMAFKEAAAGAAASPPPPKVISQAVHRAANY